MLKEKRMEVLNVINHMEKSICKPCGVIDTATCNKCPIGFEFKKLGDRLLEISNIKNEKVLSKGNDMTIKDIERLLDKGVTRSRIRSEEHTSELQSRGHLVCRLLLENNTK